MGAKEEFTQMTLTDAPWFWKQVKDTHIRAFFGGFDQSGKVGIVDVRINLGREGQSFSFNVSRYDEDQTTRFFAIGETQIASEFVLLKTDRARDDYRRWQSTLRGKSAIERASLRTIDLVRVSIKYLPSTHVGPPIHAAILQKNGTIEWVPGKECR
jgi:hypothetical protein